MPPKKRCRSLTGRREKQAGKKTTEKRRSNPELRQQDHEKNVTQMQRARSLPEIREQEQERATISRRTRSSVLKESGNIKKTTVVLQNSEYYEAEKQSTFLEEENNRNAISMTVVRQHTHYLEEENSRNAARMATVRLDVNFRQQEQAADTKRKRDKTSKKLSWDVAFAKFRQEIKEGPTNICVSCDCLFFPNQIVKRTKEKLKQKGKSDSFLERLILDNHINDTEYIFCSTCMVSINKTVESFPRFNINNSQLAFPEVPDIVKNLSPLEERCVAPRIGFMKLQALGCDQQFGLKSGLVNVPVDVRKTLKNVPALPSSTGTVELEFMRSMKYKRYMWKERVRPKILYHAAEYLVTTPLYIKEGVTMNTDWVPDENAEITIDYNFVQEENTNGINIEMTAKEAEEVALVEEYFQENPNAVDPDQQSTLERATFQPAELEEIRRIRDENDGYIVEETLLDCAQGVRFAPGEGQTPLPILMDTNCEELMFPTIWGGHARTIVQHVKLNYEDYCKSEIRRSDRRCVRPDVLFFKYKKTQIKQLMSQMNMAFRKTAQGMNITAEQALNDNFMAGLVIEDNVFRFASSVVGSPAYFEKVKKNVLAMIRQLDCPTLFVTLSAAETHWTELLVMLKKTLDKEDISEQEAENLNFDQKARLIRNDPVTCASYFNYRFRKVLQLWKSTSDGPFGKYLVEDIFFRIEFQHRGSPHVHMLVWLKDAPKLEIDVDSDESEDSVKEVISFIDELITTDTDSPDVQDIIPVQRHKCRRQCMRLIRGNEACRFSFPQPPMDQTRLLQPIPDEVKKAMERKTIEKYAQIRKTMNEVLMKDSQTVGSFEEFLVRLDCTLDVYLSTVRYPLKHGKFFLKRLPKNCAVNGYNLKTLIAMRSNMDIQYVTDPFACVGYVVDYINKASRGLSRLLRQVVEDFNKGNHSLRDKLKAISNVLFNSTEISAQEAAWIRLQLAMTSTSVAVEFIHSGPQEKRHKMLKSKNDLKEILEEDPQSTDILKKGPIDRYSLRPDELEEICLAQFIASYTFMGKGGDDGGDDNNNDIEELEDFNDNLDDEQVPKKLKTYTLKEKEGKIKERRRNKVIRYCRFDINKNPEDYYREMIQLFLPWRDEPISSEVNCEVIYKNNLEEIQKNFKIFNKIDKDLNDIYNAIHMEREAEENEIEAHPENRERDQDEEEELQRALVNVFDFDDTIIQPSAEHEMGLAVHGVDEVKRYKIPQIMNTEEVEKLCNSLNTLQHAYLMNCLSLFKSKGTPFYHYIAGGAGVGKSMLIKALFQLITRLFRSNTTGPGDSIEVLLVAFTGAAAHNINGMTAHSAFHLSTSEGTTKFKNLSDDNKNTLRAHLRYLKLIIIDEISMLSSDHIMEIDQRLREIHNPNLPFGGMSVMAVGDFHQLRPVGAHYVFQNTISKSSLRSLLGNTIWPLFTIFELTEIMRQKEDKDFAEMLLRVSEYKHTPDDVKTLESRVFSEDTLPEEGKNAVWLVLAQKDIQAHNNKCLARIVLPDGTRPPTYKYQAIDNLIGTNISKSQKERTLYMLNEIAISYDNKKTKNLPKEIEFVVGFRYMVSTNVDVSDGLYNGAVGTLQFIEIQNNKIKAVWLEFPKAETGVIARSNRRGIIQANQYTIRDDWTPIVPKKETFKITKQRITVCREQFPLLMAEAWTYYKSQGQSLVASTQKQTSITKMRMSLPMFYVGISRSTSLNGLFIISDLPLKIPNPTKDALDALAELDRMRKDCKLKLKFSQIMKEVHPEYIQITSFNAQSIRAHLDVFNCDGVFKSSDVIILQETWAKENEQYDISNMMEVVRNTIPLGSERGRGSSIYAKLNLNPLCALKNSENVFASRHIEITSCLLNDIQIVNIYRSPDQTLHPLDLQAALKNHEHCMSNKNLLVFGDFNYNIDTYGDFDRFFETNYGIKLFSPRDPTTDTGTTIDGVYGRLRDYDQSCFIYESYVSYHKPIVIQIKNK